MSRQDCYIACITQTRGSWPETFMQDRSYTYSQLSPGPVVRLLELHYNLPASVNCRFYVLGLHDNYLIESGHEKFILRIYRNAWRSHEEIQFELELLSFLGSNTAAPAVQVASPIPTNNGDLSFNIDSPEGERTAVLFRYADGTAPGNEITTQESELLGNAVANLHLSSGTFSTPHARPVLDLPYLLDKSLAAIAPYVTTESRAYLEALKNRVRRELPALTRDHGCFGICTGDVNPTNFHIDNNRNITLFDFDQCGYGFRAFEIGKFISSIHPLKMKHEIAKAFLSGYQQVRSLSAEELHAIPYYEIVSVIWVMAIHVYNVDRIGYKWLEQSFWDRRLAILRELENIVPGQYIEGS